MLTCNCPNCGQEISVPWWLPRTVTCKSCHTRSIVPYAQDPNFDDYNALAKIKVKSNDFRTAHPKIMKGVAITAILAAVGVGAFYQLTGDNGTDAAPLDEFPDDSSEEPDCTVSSACRNDSLSGKSLSEPEGPEESVTTRREYSPHDLDCYDYAVRHHDIAMIHFTKGQQASQEKRDEFREKTGDDLPPNTSFKKAYDQKHQVKKN